jgi:hypothetical protein
MAGTEQQTPEPALGFFHKLVAGPIDQVMDRVLPVLERKFDELSAKVMALLPLLAAAAADQMMNRVEKRFAQVLKADPDLPIVSNLFDLSETIRGQLNDSTPAGIEFPGLDILGDLLSGFRR